jgi:hypothetical protein
MAKAAMPPIVQRRSLVARVIGEIAAGVTALAGSGGVSLMHGRSQLIDS